METVAKMETEQPGNDEDTPSGSTQLLKFGMSLGNESLDHGDTGHGHEQP